MAPKLRSASLNVDGNAQEREGAQGQQHVEDNELQELTEGEEVQQQEEADESQVATACNCE